MLERHLGVLLGVILGGTTLGVMLVTRIQPEPVIDVIPATPGPLVSVSMVDVSPAELGRYAVAVASHDGAIPAGTYPEVALAKLTTAAELVDLDMGDHLNLVPSPDSPLGLVILRGKFIGRTRGLLEYRAPWLWQGYLAYIFHPEGTVMYQGGSESGVPYRRVLGDPRIPERDTAEPDRSLVERVLDQVNSLDGSLHDWLAERRH